MPAVGRAAAVVRRKPRGPKSKGDAKQSHGQRRQVKKPYHRRENIGCFGSRKYSNLAYRCQDIRDAGWFQTTLIAVIGVAGVLVGIQTYDIPPGTFQDTIEVMDLIILYIFILEIVIKMVAEGNHPLQFFADGWNVFDFLIVAVGLMPFGGNAITALRLVRLLRVLKLVRALPKLRILVMGLLLSMSSIAYIGMLLMLLFYLFAVLGVSVFGFNDPVHFGTLHMAFITLFRCSTLEDWTDVMYISMFGCDQYGYDGMEELCVQPSQQPVVAVAFNCVFVTLASMMILNLFIGVITSSMAEAKTNLSVEAENMEPDPDFSLIGQRINDLETEMHTIVRELQEAIAEKAAQVADVTPDMPVTVGEVPSPPALDTVSPIGAGIGLGEDSESSRAGALDASVATSTPIARLTSRQRLDRLFTPSQRRIQLAQMDARDEMEATSDSKESPAMRLGTSSARVTPESSPPGTATPLLGRGAIVLEGVDAETATSPAEK